MTAAQERLITDNYALAPYCARKYAASFPKIEADDMLSIAHLGLVEAARHYDPTQCSFANYAINAIYKTYQKEMNYRACKKRTALVVELTDFMAEPSSDVEFSIDFRDTLDAAMRETGKREKEGFVLHYIQGYTQREIGDMYGLSHERVRQLAELVCKRFRVLWERAHWDDCA